jgi:hypothetical protein
VDVPDEWAVELLALWAFVVLVAAAYLGEWLSSHGRRPMPLHRHPVALLAQAARLVLRLWPLAVISTLSALMSRAQRLPEYLQMLYTSRPFLEGLRGGLSDIGGSPWGMGRALLSGGLAREAHCFGPLVWGVLAAAGGWAALANPWRLTRRRRLLAGLGAVAAIAVAALHGSPGVTAWERTLAGRIAGEAAGVMGNAFATGVVAAIIWGAYPRGKKTSAGTVACRALAGFIAAAVVDAIAHLPYWAAPPFRTGGPDGPGLLHDVLRTWLPMVVDLVLVWPVWAAVSAQRDPLNALTNGWRLVWRNRAEFLLLAARMSVAMLPVAMLGSAIRFTVLGPVDWVLAAPVALWAFAATGLAYRAFALATGPQPAEPAPAAEAEAPE